MAGNFDIMNSFVRKKNTVVVEPSQAYGNHGLQLDIQLVMNPHAYNFGLGPVSAPSMK